VLPAIKHPDSVSPAETVSPVKEPGSQDHDHWKLGLGQAARPTWTGPGR
jgi:hypothetical protein